MKNRISVTIGILAHNEAANIFNLIDSILFQKSHISYIEKIIIIYSGHNSLKISQELNDKYKGQLTIITDSKRTSKIDKLNRISKLSQSDITLILDGDIVISDENLVENISKPFIDDEDILITTPVLKPYSTKNLLQKILNTSIKAKIYSSDKWNNGDNYIKAIGRSCAYKTSFLKKITVPNLMTEDFFLYIKSKELGGKIQEIKKSEVKYYLPKNLKDHVRQSSRFLSNERAFNKIISQDSINMYGKIPMKIKLIFFIKMFVINPIHTILYILIFVYSKIYSTIFFSDKAEWNISQSTKNN